MNNVTNKANNTAGALGQLDAVNDWDPISTENNNAVTDSGQQLNSAITHQLSMAQAINGCAAETFTENSPGANVANLTPLTGQNGIQMPTNAAAASADAYSLMNGYIVSFYHSVASTTNSATGFTILIGQTIASYLTGKYLVLIGGGAIPVGAIFGFTRIRYNTSAGYWELLESDGFNKQNQQNPTNYYMNGTFQVSLAASSWADGVLAINTTNWLWERHRLYVTDKLGITLSASQQKLAPGTADELVLLNEGCHTYGRIGASGPGTAPGTGVYSHIQHYIKGGAVLLGGGRYVTVTFKARSSVSGKKLGVAGEQYYGTGGSPSSNTVLQGSVLTLTTSFAQYNVTLTTTSLSGITLGTTAPADDALIIDFFQMWGATIGSTYMNSGNAETYSPSGACNIDITEIRVTPTYCPLPYSPKSYDIEVLDCINAGYLLQKYVAGNTYNGVALNVTSTGGTVVKAIFYPHPTVDGLWTIDIYLVMSFTSVGGGTNTIAIAGVTFYNLGNYNQGLVCSSGSNKGYIHDCAASQASGNITVYSLAPAGADVYSISGIADLEQYIPTWVIRY